VRREFPAKVKVAAFERCGGQCERCTARLGPGNVEYHHRIADALGGEPVLENCEVLCRACHSVSTRTVDVPAVARAKRREAKHLGAHRSSRPMPGGRQSKWKKKLSGEVIAR
jgi:5-methylcytosine-specific restriction enzyme A